MSKSEAYEIVYNDLMNISLFKGKYDAINGSQSFMHGIETVIEFVAANISSEKHDDFNNMFINNLIKSEEKAGIA